MVCPCCCSLLVVHLASVNLPKFDMMPTSAMERLLPVIVKDVPEEAHMCWVKQGSVVGPVIRRGSVVWRWTIYMKDDLYEAIRIII
ncbi:uncharacterized protein LOC115090090 isoform X3 [Rhinatrema bivittatum]|uniref:uncharacterized protein LOC115090090 isoform X3 n=1 Tax=Rhinatrema bivittatum TaxID=194408 RepID=UPI00112BC438|nr:uncharacterized protein LOC115090090 isoform X3 [Rhinatrema bivittatum]